MSNNIRNFPSSLEPLEYRDIESEEKEGASISDEAHKENLYKIVKNALGIIESAQAQRNSASNLTDKKQWKNINDQLASIAASIKTNAEQSNSSSLPTTTVQHAESSPTSSSLPFISHAQEEMSSALIPSTPPSTPLSSPIPQNTVPTATITPITEPTLPPKPTSLSSGITIFDKSLLKAKKLYVVFFKTIKPSETLKDKGILNIDKHFNNGFLIEWKTNRLNKAEIRGNKCFRFCSSNTIDSDSINNNSIWFIEKQLMHVIQDKVSSCLMRWESKFKTPIKKILTNPHLTLDNRRNYMFFHLPELKLLYEIWELDDINMAISNRISSNENEIIASLTNEQKSEVLYSSVSEVERKIESEENTTYLNPDNINGSSLPLNFLQLGIEPRHQSAITLFPKKAYIISPESKELAINFFVRLGLSPICDWHDSENNRWFEQLEIPSSYGNAMDNLNDWMTSHSKYQQKFEEKFSLVSPTGISETGQGVTSTKLIEIKVYFNSEEICTSSGKSEKEAQNNAAKTIILKLAESLNMLEEDDANKILSAFNDIEKAK